MTSNLYLIFILKKNMLTFIKLPLLILVIIILGTLASNAKDDLITVTQESDRIPLASGKSVSVQSVCLENSLLISGGGECYGFLNTRNKVVLSKSAPDSTTSAWNVECTNLNREAGEAQAKAWAVCKKL